MSAGEPRSPDGCGGSAPGGMLKSRPWDDDRACDPGHHRPMFHRRGVTPIILLLLLIVLGFVVRAVRGPAAASRGASASIVASPNPAPMTGASRAVLKTLTRVQRAYDAGNVRRLCRPGNLIDAAVISRENARSGGCEQELEGLMATVPRLRIEVRELALEPDLATATVSSAGGASVPVDLVRGGRGWLLSFSDGADPIPALAGTE
jgi:hypothetical protein